MLRAQQDLNQGKTTIGAMVTAVNRDINDEALDFLHRQAYSGGIDFFHSWKNRNYYVCGQRRVQPGAGQRGGAAAHADIVGALLPAPRRRLPGLRSRPHLALRPRRHRRDRPQRRQPAALQRRRDLALARPGAQRHGLPLQGRRHHELGLGRLPHLQADPGSSTRSA